MPASLREIAQPPREGRIPSHYHAQVQHQLEVSGAEELHYWSFDGNDGMLIEVRPDREYAKRLVEAETAFWQRVNEQRWPEWQRRTESERRSKVASRRASLP